MIESLKRKIIPPTYVSGLLQAKAYRILRTGVNSTLKEYKISMTEWAVLGLLYESRELKLFELAAKMDVEAPLATALINNLIQKKLVQKVSDPLDKRAKLLKVTKNAEELVPSIERKVRNQMKELLKGVSILDLFSYMRVLSLIERNNAEKENSVVNFTE